MTLDRLMVYEHSIEESKVSRIARSLKRSGASDQEQTSFKKNVKYQGESMSAKFKVQKGIGIKEANPTLQIVATNIMISIYWVPGIAFVVAKMGIV